MDREPSRPPGPSETRRRLRDAARSVPGALRSGGAHRARWGIADQVVSSLTNFSITLIVAREAAPRQFGAFSVALTVYIFVVWVGRSLVAEPFVVRHGAVASAERRQTARAAVGAAIAVGAVAAVVMIPAGIALGSPSAGVLLAMAASMPSLLAQDAYRYVLIADGRARAATGNDSLWLAVQTAAVVGLVASGRADAVTLTLSFGLGALCAALMAARQAGVRPAPASAGKWLRDHRDLGAPFLLELVAVNGVTQLALIGVAVVAGVVAVGELRAATLLMSPPTVLLSGLFVVGITEAVKLRRRSLDRLSALVVALAVCTSLITVVWAIGLVVLPDRAGTSLLGANWAPARALLVPVAALIAANACIAALVVGLRGLAAARQSLRARVWAAPVVLTAGLGGTWVYGAQGAAVGMAAGSWFSVVLTWSAFRTALAAERAGQAADDAVEDPLVAPGPTDVGIPVVDV